VPFNNESREKAITIFDPGETGALNDRFACPKSDGEHARRSPSRESDYNESLKKQDRFNADCNSAIFNP
jgi:hypothetical protein